MPPAPLRSWFAAYETAPALTSACTRAITDHRSRDDTVPRYGTADL